jgi:hypothetical protein
LDAAAVEGVEGAAVEGMRVAAGGAVAAEPVVAGWFCGKILLRMLEKMLILRSECLADPDESAWECCNGYA